MRGSGTVLTLPSQRRGLPETGEVSTGLHALLAGGMLNRHTPSTLSDQPKPSQGPTVQPGPFRERCRGDSDCPDVQKCCNSSCGHQCLPGALWGKQPR
uniref:WAP domain-containing protein n=1 Tax=Zosterops lateralis melanops TaxID=1220523 RepID=A0A8D2P7Q0_ZOSLA